MTNPQNLQESVDAVIASRKSVRAFLPNSISRAEIEQILRVASRAPSGTNTQPWRVYVLTGATLARFKERILGIHNQPELAKTYREEYHYYPEKWISPYIERRRKVGWDLYALLGLERDNKAGIHQQHGRNYQFFDAPVGLIFTVDRIMAMGSWLDYGMFLQNIMLAARARGMDTCPQAAFTQYHRVIQELLQFPDNEMVVCGMALGYADLGKIENTLVTERAPVSEFSVFYD